jgi:hypothetical protein
MEEDNLCETRMGSELILVHNNNTGSFYHIKGMRKVLTECMWRWGFNEHVSFPKLLHYFGLVRSQRHTPNACKDGDDLMKP